MRLGLTEAEIMKKIKMYEAKKQHRIMFKYIGNFIGNIKRDEFA